MTRWPSAPVAPGDVWVRRGRRPPRRRAHRPSPAAGTSVPGGRVPACTGLASLWVTPWLVLGCLRARLVGVPVAPWRVVGAAYTALRVGPWRAVGCRRGRLGGFAGRSWRAVRLGGWDVGDGR